MVTFKLKVRVDFNTFNDKIKPCFLGLPTDLFVDFTNVCNTKHAGVFGGKRIRCLNQENHHLKMSLLHGI